MSFGWRLLCWSRGREAEGSRWAGTVESGPCLGNAGRGRWPFSVAPLLLLVLLSLPLRRLPPAVRTRRSLRLVRKESALWQNEAERKREWNTHPATGAPLGDLGVAVRAW